VKALFLDESGDHSLESIDPEFPIFVLGGVVVDYEYAIGEMETELRRFKRQYFGSEELILHTADIVRSQKGFEALRDPDRRALVFDGLSQLMRRLDYKVIACAILKQEHRERYGVRALDPYLYSLDVLIERFVFEIESSGDRTPGVVIAEKRGSTLDRELDLAWERLKTRGTRYLQASRVAARISEVSHWSKQTNSAGLQLADLVVNPIARLVLGRKIFPDMRIVQEKLRRDHHGNYLGAGLVVLPPK
jgi:gluconate kinase